MSGCRDLQGDKFKSLERTLPTSKETMTTTSGTTSISQTEISKLRRRLLSTDASLTLTLAAPKLTSLKRRAALTSAYTLREDVALRV